ncbi:Damage inducible protein [Salmonella enterica]|uniref:Damage inducible protein n=1 Tax=Salmonella diarizonae TaxID=59204 RepID=A0A5Y1YF36_SALDZ|nr:Damage inducible protein [Salmonella enterica]ECC3916755.1 Damage inducible protein [Salmonella enterica subsp. diarizonae]EDR7001697.1 Damage inducible protein [Salmonella enterica subsp. enterica serovar Java]
MFSLHLMEKRMGAFIDKAIMVLRVLIALLELIRVLID